MRPVFSNICHASSQARFCRSSILPSRLQLVRKKGIYVEGIGKGVKQRKALPFTEGEGGCHPADGWGWEHVERKAHPPPYPDCGGRDRRNPRRVCQRSYRGALTAHRAVEHSAPLYPSSIRGEACGGHDMDGSHRGEPPLHKRAGLPLLLFAVAELFEEPLAVAPVLADLHIHGEEHLRAEQLFHVLPRKGGGLFERLALLSY